MDYDALSHVACSIRAHFPRWSFETPERQTELHGSPA
jgi:hypothetical protein